MQFRGALTAVLLIAVLSASPFVARAAAPVAPVEEIKTAVRSYMTAIDAGDLDAQMTFWSADPVASSVIMGEIWTGVAKIRARSAEYVPVSRVMRNESGETTVVPLDSATALSITPYRAVRRNPDDVKLKSYELDSMLTLVWAKSPDGWKIIHEHVSVKIPPPK